MEIYLNDIRTGVLVFPVLAFFMTLPYMLYQYRKYHSIPFWKSFIFYAFLFYVLCAYFMVILPLPEARTAAEAGVVSVAPIFEPFRFVGQFIVAARKVGLSLVHPQTWVAFLQQPDVYCVLFNVLLTLPLGMFVRYIFRAKWWQALLAGFGMSLFYELSQLTGLFGYYDYAYRLFEVDDLIVNTAGCMLGWAIMLPLEKRLPDFRELSGAALSKGAWMASFARRFAAFALDMTLAAACTTSVIAVHSALGGVFDPFLPLVVMMVFEGVFLMLVPSLMEGQTLGQRLVRIRTVRRDGSLAEPWRFVVRYGLFVWLFLMGPLWIIELLPLDTDAALLFAVRGVMTVIYGVWLVTILVRAIRNLFGHPFLMLNGAVSDTTVMTDAEITAHRMAAAMWEGMEKEASDETEVPEAAPQE